MRPPEEKLTRKQLYFCSGIMAVTFLAFSSVFAYAYIKGAQVRTKNEQSQANHVALCASASNGDIRKTATRIAQGSRGQANNIEFRETKALSSSWTITKLTEVKTGGPQPASPIIAYSASPSGWAIYPTGVVAVPQKAQPGLYALECSAGEYVFEVVSKLPCLTKRAQATVPHLHQTSAPLKVLPEDTQRFSADIERMPSADQRDMEEW